MITFPNPSFRKYSYPKSQSLRLRAINPLSSRKYILYDCIEEYTHYLNENFAHSPK